MNFPIFFFVSATVLLALLLETIAMQKKPWALPAAMTYLTIVAWYFADPFIAPENYDFLPDYLLETAYGQVLIFLVTYRCLMPMLAHRIGRDAEGFIRRGSPPLSAGVLLKGTILSWLALLTFGVALMDGNLLGALFPTEARAGDVMWARGAAGDAGATGFLVSTGSYLYILVCGAFGVLYFFVKKKEHRFVCVALMIISWPFFLLSGTRSIFLAVCSPFFLAFLLFSKRPTVVKVFALSIAFLIVNAALLFVIQFRSAGITEYFLAEKAGELDSDVRHQGLNMLQELCFTNVFASTNAPSYGIRYLIELSNVIPRVLWANKPLIGIDYAVFRGFAGGDADIGVFATISTGLIGGGVMNFGPYLGPVAPGILMSLYTALLARWWRQRESVMRSILFLLGVGLTFNLGRDFTLLVLWPVVFGFVIVKILERVTSQIHRARNARRNAGSLPAPSAA